MRYASTVVSRFMLCCYAFYLFYVWEFSENRPIWEYGHKSKYLQSRDICNAPMWAVGHNERTTRIKSKLLQ